MQAVRGMFRRAMSTTTTTTTTSSHPSSSSFGRASGPLRTGISDMLKLSKHRLSFLVAFTATTGYLCRADGNDEDEASAKSGGNKFVVGVMSTTIGTFLTAASANTLNQVYERFSDMRMERTRLRPIPSGRVSVGVALMYAAVTATTGLVILKTGTNDVATGLSLANLVLYSGVYTPLKAMWVGNTTIGAIVGAIPPLIGWTAASNGRLFSEREQGAWALASLLFLWQIPHFHALAVALRQDYARAGLKMLAVSQPVCNAAWARICAWLLIPTGIWMNKCGVTSEAFAWQMGLLSWWMANSCKNLVHNPVCRDSARYVFRTSIVHLPVSLALLLAHHQTYPSGTTQVVHARAHTHAEREEEQEEGRREIRLHQPWEVIAPFPFLPVPRGAPAVVLDAE